MATRQPFGSYALMIALGFLPTALVTQYYDILPNRLIIKWDMFGNTTIIGTRASSVLLIANAAAVIALGAIAVGVWLHRSLVALGMRRAYLGLNLAQIVAINLTCAMIVTQALGFDLKIKPMVPPAMAALLFAAAVLCWRIDQGRGNRAARVAAISLGVASLALLAFSAVAVNEVVGYFASAVAALAMVALALPEDR